MRYYYQTAQKKQIALGGDHDHAMQKWAELHLAERTGSVAGTFGYAAKEFLAHGLKGRTAKTQYEYQLAVIRLNKVFETKPMVSILPGHIGSLMHALRDTPFQANRFKAAMSRIWNWSRSRGLTSAPNPCVGVEGHPEPPRKVQVTPAMFWLIYEYADQVLQDWMRLDMLIGQRVSDVTTITRAHITQNGSALRLKARKNDAKGAMAITGDLADLISELLTRERSATGPWLLQTDSGQRVTYAMLRNRFDDARERARGAKPDEYVYWQMRDLRKASLNQAATIEEARRRGLHLDARTTAKHYELLIESVPASLPKKPGEPELLTTVSNSQNKTG